MNPITELAAFFEAYAEHGAEWGLRLAAGAVVTAELSLLGFALALAGGAALAAALGSAHAGLRGPAQALVQAMRSVPLLALLLLLYFGLPPLGITLGSFTTGVLGLGLYGAASIAVIVQGGLASVPRGQREAALAAGLTPARALRHVVLPQALRVMTAPLLNAYVALLKDSSLCALIASNELMLAARAMSSEYFLPMQVFLLAGLFYFVIAFPLSLLARWLDRRLGTGRRDLGTAA
jgi:His/Glu/Gln/Arg/opine family amino acid ABC transporter permease subunit